MGCTTSRCETFFLCKKCHISYSKVWLTTYLVRPSINVLLDHDMVKGNRQYQIQASESELQTQRAECKQAVLSFLTVHFHSRFSWSSLDCSWSCIAMLVFHNGSRPRPDRGGLETPTVAWPQSSSEETVQLFKYQKVINSPWEEVGSPQFHLQATYVYPTSLSSLWFNKTQPAKSF